MRNFIAFFILSFTLLPSAAETNLATPQTVHVEEKSFEAQKSPVPQSSTVIPLDSFPIAQDGSEKQKRIKKLEKKILATSGLKMGSDFGISWGPRMNKLYTLHNEMTDGDWNLLAEMYMNFGHSRKDYSHKNLVRLENGISTLLAINGQDSINKLNEIVDNAITSYEEKEFLRHRLNDLIRYIEIKPWAILSEYKKDQEKACSAGEMSACAELGCLYERGIGISTKQNYPKAKELYERACVSGEMFACTGLGRLYEEGNGVERDTLKAKELYEKACDTDENIACAALGRLYKRGKGIEHNFFKAKEYYEKACNLQYEDGCNEYERIKAIEVQERTCAVGEMSACSSLGLLYEEGYSMDQDFLKAKELYESACNAGEMSGCAGLGRLYDEGKGIEQDTLKTEALYEKACNASSAVCNSIADSYKYGAIVKRDYSKAMKYYEKACNADYAESCWNLGEFYFQGWGVAQDYAKAREFYKKACDLGHQGACYEYKRLNER